MDQNKAEQSLIQSIHKSEEPVTNLSVEDHILAVANNRDHVNRIIILCFSFYESNYLQVVPIALIMCLSNCSYTQAKIQIAKCPRIRDICTGAVNRS